MKHMYTCKYIAQVVVIFFLHVQENSIGGFGDHVIHFMHDAGLLDDGKVKGVASTPRARGRLLLQVSH